MRDQDQADVSLLVTGATGMQGGAVLRAARAAGIEVTAMVRDPDTPAARALSDSGFSLVRGDLEDVPSLITAFTGHSSVFSVQLPPGRDPDSERRQGANLACAAGEAGVARVVHTSVSGTGWRDSRPDVDPGVLADYWSSKEAVEADIRAAGPAFTIVKPAFFLENLIPPKSPWMFPLLSEGVLLVACAADTRLAVVGAEMFGAAVATIVGSRGRYDGCEIEFGSDTVTFHEIAEAISNVTGRRVVASHGSAAEIDERLGRRSWSPTQVWFDEVGYPARPEHAAEQGLRAHLTLREWAERNRDALGNSVDTTD